MNEEFYDEIKSLYTWIAQLENGDFDAIYNGKDPIIIEQIKNYIKGIYLGVPITDEPSNQKDIPAPEKIEEFVLFLVKTFHDAWLFMNSSEELENEIQYFLSQQQNLPSLWHNELLFLLYLLKYNRSLKAEQLLSVIELRVTEEESRLYQIPPLNPTFESSWRLKLLELISLWLSEDEMAGQKTMEYLELAINKKISRIWLAISISILFEYSIFYGDFILAKDMLFILQSFLSEMSEYWQKWYEKNNLIIGILLGSVNKIDLSFNPVEYFNKKDLILNIRLLIITTLFERHAPKTKDKMARTRPLFSAFKGIEFKIFSPVEKHYLNIVTGFELEEKGYIDQAINLINDALFPFEDAKDYCTYCLIILLTDLSLIYYSSIGSGSWLKRAETFLDLNEKFIELTFSPLLAINTYIHRSIVSIAKGKLDEAVKWIERGRSVAKQHGNMGYLLWIENVYDFIQNTKQAITQSLKQLLQVKDKKEMSFIVTPDSPLADKDDYAMIFYAFQETGPTPVWAVDGDKIRVEEDEVFLLRMGTYLYILIGQGHNYPEGFYGPLPTTDHPELENYVLSLMIYDPVQKDPRLREQNYMILSIIVPKGKSISPLPREYLFRELSTFIIENPSIIYDKNKFSTRFRNKLDSINKRYFSYFGEKD